MVYVDLTLNEVKRKLFESGYWRTTSKRFIRYEKPYKDSCITIGVEITKTTSSKYSNLFVLVSYVFDCVNYNEILKEQQEDLEVIFKDNLIKF